jgi:hypothetical protein
MTRSLLHKTLVAVIAAAVVATGIGSVVAAPESPANDCLVGLQDADSTTIATDQTCTDGDAACDADGAADGTCTFHLRGCVNLPVSGCTPRPIKKVKFAAPHSRDKVVVTPVSGQPSSVCGSFIDFHVPLKKKGKKPGKRKIIASATADVKPRGQNKDKDKVTFNCNPGTGGGSTTTTTLPTGPSECPANPDGGPDQLTLTVGNTGNDLDTGFSGQSHNFLNVTDSTLKYCLTGCDASTNSTCQASGSTGAGSLNGPTFGPPLPLFSAGVAVCVVNRLQDANIQAVVDVATGAFDATATPLRLLSDTYQGSSNQVCPRCVSGKCDSGRNQGQNCQVDGSVVVNNPPNVNNVTYNVSKSCLPSQANLLGTPNVVLPLTTATSTLDGHAAGNFPCAGQAKHDECGGGACTVDCSAKPDPKGGINQTCCSTGIGVPCFPTDPSEAAGSMSRTGTPANISPAWPDPTYPKTGPGTLAATFCIPATGSTTVDATAGLAGPGAVLIAGTSTYVKAP